MRNKAMQNIKLESLTVEEYLQLEENSAIRHEYVDGSIFAMTGANQRHSLIQGNVFAALFNFLDGHPCRPFMENMKVRVKEANCFYYPDVMVTCSGLDDDDSVYNEFPVLIIEVLSQSTASTDRREKLCNYLKLSSLREYALINQQRRKVELYRRSRQDIWDKFDFQFNDNVVFESMPNGRLSLAMDVIYKNLKEQGTPPGKEDVPEYLFSDSELYDLAW